MMDMTIGDCQLSKLYAYNGLMLSSGIRIDGIGIDRPHRVVVIDNPTRTERNVSVITVEDDGTQSSTRKYHRVEKKEDIEITCFDGEGLISKEYARVVDEKLCGKKVHTSFQIRMPYVKGMLHEVDFKDFLTLCGTDTITDLWGMEHSVRDVDVILIDTAGRLHNKTNLMNELNKISRIVARELPDAAKEVLLVLDGTTGQNGLIQAKQFKEIAGVTAIALTKLDGTAKGGIVIAVADALQIPVKFVGVGEQADDLMPFSAKEFVEALI